MAPPPRTQAQAPRTTSRSFTAVVLPMTQHIHALGRPCGCDTHSPSEDLATDGAPRQQHRAGRRAARLLHELVLAAAHGAAYTCGAGGAGAVLYWLTHR
ncbi:hypothetical protein ACFV7R_45910 [Streptomyces sp. NPDC059866]|uniref:hypothetical protein n=1 Tax=Streptomyces sp. NPDC059866 TaxID=3346978 RepID=UPI003668C187